MIPLIYQAGVVAHQRLLNDGSSSWTLLSSGLIRYRRGIDKITGQYVLDYSADGGLTWENLISEDPAEDTILQDKTHLYRHRIVGTSYRIDEALTPIGFAGTENTDWENIYST